jgi:hypothetical protein
MSEPWIPGLEANQGTISVVALVLALVRANTQRQRELEEEIEDAISLLEELDQFVGDDAVFIGLPNVDPDRVIDEVGLIAAALRALAAAHVKKPTLSLPLLRAAHIAEMMQAMSVEELEAEAEEMSYILSALKGDVEEALEVARRRVVFRRRERRKVDSALARLLNERLQRQRT